MLKFGKNAFLDVPQEELRKQFDSDAYCEIYGDVLAAGIDPFQHYIEHGWKEDRRPSRDFDVEYYRSTHMGGDTAICPFAHYVKFGLSENLPTAPGNPEELTVSEEQITPDSAAYTCWYGEQNTAWNGEMLRLLKALGHDTEQFGDLPFGLYLKAMFSPEVYRSAKGLGQEISDNECFLRYLAFDFIEGMPPGPFFNEESYLRRVSEASFPPPVAGEYALQHWLRLGLPKDISPNDLFSSQDYLRLHKDLENAPGALVAHFLLHGINEGRQFSPEMQITHEADSKPSNNIKRFFDTLAGDSAATAELGAMRHFRRSRKIGDLIGSACAIEPDITLNRNLTNLLPPWHDAAYLNFKAVIDQLPEGEFNSVVLIPFCKVGGADYVAGILSRLLDRIAGPVLVIQTDEADWACPEWFGEAARIDISGILRGLGDNERTNILYSLLCHVAPNHVFNINSRLAFDTLVRFGKQLAYFTRLYAYYFCADRTVNGVETGYPVWYFAHIFEHLTAAITDSVELATVLSDRYCLTPRMAERLHPIYTPAMTTQQHGRAVVDAQLENRHMRARPALIWAGRFDRQKRFDLLLEVAREMPHVDFLCWGKAVLDAPPDLENLPVNVQLHSPFTSYDELPLDRVDGFFYTSDWDGIPTILIELGGYGMPIVASASGGVPELITETTGWTVPVGTSAADYARVIEAVLADPEERRTRAHALRAHVETQHSEANYTRILSAALEI